MKKIKKRCMTLVEIMIVMFLIAMITGVIAYNYTGSLEEGKAFKTKAGIEKIKTVLALSAAEGSLDETADRWKDIVKSSPLVQNYEDLVKDGWGGEYRVTVEDTENGEKQLVVFSQKYENYLKKNGKSSLFKN